MPNGVIKKSAELGVVVTSSNFAIIKSEENLIVVNSSQRSLYNFERDELQSRIAKHLELIGAVSSARSSYPAWEMKENSLLSSQAQELYRQMFSQEAVIKVIHAGLECGIFNGKNPQLEMLSFGPTIKSPHSPSEYLEMESLGYFYDYLRQLIKKIA